MKEIHLNPKQTQFVKSKVRYSAFGGGLGSGKTLAGILKAYRAALEHPGTLGLIGRLNYKQLKETTRRDFYDVVPTNEIAARNDTEGFCKFKNGSEILFWAVEDSNKKRISQLQNLNLGFFWLDQAEEIPEEVFLKLRGRLRNRKGPGQGWLTFNMAGKNYIYFYWKKPEEDGKLSESFELIETTTLDNIEHLPTAYVKDLLAYPPAWVRRFVYGSWEEFSGLVWDNYSDDIHLLDVFEIPNGWRKFAAVDHGRSAPTCVLLGATNGEYIVIYDCYYAIGGVVRDHVYATSLGGKRVKDLLKEVEFGWIDSQTFAKTQEKKGEPWSVQEEWYSQSGVYLDRTNKDRQKGIEFVYKLLAIDPNLPHPVTGVKGSPRLFFLRSIADPIRDEIHQWKLKEGELRGGIYIPNDKTETVGSDDAMDTLRYLCMGISPYMNVYYSLDELKTQAETERKRKYKVIHYLDEDYSAESWMSL